MHKGYSIVEYAVKCAGVAVFVLNALYPRTRFLSDSKNVKMRC